MKARVKETGEIIDVECRFYAKIGSTDPIIHNGLLEILKDDEIIDWEQRRYELAKAAMQGLLNATSVERFVLRIKPSSIAQASLEYADELIKKLKNNNKKSKV